MKYITFLKSVDHAHALGGHCLLRLFGRSTYMVGTVDIGVLRQSRTKWRLPAGRFVGVDVETCTYPLAGPWRESGQSRRQSRRVTC